MNPNNVALIALIFCAGNSICHGSFVLKILDVRCDPEIEPKISTALICKLDTKKEIREFKIGMTPAIPIEDFEMNVEIFRMRGKKTKSVFNATENICKMVKVPTSLSFIYHLARVKAPDIVHPCPYVNPTYITVTEEDLKFMAPTASLLVDPGKYRVHLNVMIGDHVAFNLRIYAALRNPKN